MLRREFIAGTTAPALLAQTRKFRPHILYIHSHDTGRYLQPYGHAVPAPNLQRLAEAGVLFRQAFDAAPTCSPSRASRWSELGMTQPVCSSAMAGCVRT